MNITPTQLKKYSIAYDMLQDLNEYDLSYKISDKLEAEGYKIFVVRDKYKFKYVGGHK